MQRRSHDVLLAGLRWPSTCDVPKGEKPSIHRLKSIGCAWRAMHRRKQHLPTCKATILGKWACTSASICSARSGL